MKNRLMFCIQTYIYVAGEKTMNYVDLNAIVDPNRVRESVLGWEL